MRWLGFAFLLAACSLSAQTSVVPEIQYRSVPDFLHQPSGKLTGTRCRELANRMVIQVVGALVQQKSKEAEDDLIKAIAAIGGWNRKI